MPDEPPISGEGSGIDETIDRGSDQVDAGSPEPDLATSNGQISAAVDASAQTKRTSTSVVTLLGVKAAQNGRRAIDSHRSPSERSSRRPADLSLHPSSDDDDVSGEAAEPVADAVEYVRDYLQHHELTVLYDGRLQRGGMPDEADIDARLRHEAADESTVFDDILLELRAEGRTIPKSVLKPAFRFVLRSLKAERRRVVMAPLYVPLAAEELLRAEARWIELGTKVFPDKPVLAIACLQHFVWSVLRKSLSRDIQNHQMPIIYSPIQDTGKTTIVKRLCGPLAELATGPVTLAQVADPRSSAIFQFPVIITDDTDPIRGPSVEILKSVITAENLPRRRMGASSITIIPQKATLIGSSNRPVDQLVPDDTGTRRFVDLPFKNGNVNRGGDPEVWQVINTTDWVALWRSIDHTGPSPLEPHLADLAIEQNAKRPVEIVRRWLRGLDLRSEAMMNIAQPIGIPPRSGYRTRDLLELCAEHTGLEMNDAWFVKTIEGLVYDPHVPFARMKRTNTLRVWMPKTAFQ